jgi:hypothetical protein
VTGLTPNCDRGHGSQAALREIMMLFEIPSNRGLDYDAREMGVYKELGSSNRHPAQGGIFSTLSNPRHLA